MNIPDVYFLTAKEKAKTLNDLVGYIEAGHIDEKMIPWIKKFNALSGVVTQFCCEGHRKDKDRMPYKIHGGYGNLIVRLSRTAFKKLYLHKYDGHTQLIDRHELQFRDLGGDSKWCRICIDFHYLQRELVLKVVYEALKERLHVRT